MAIESVVDETHFDRAKEFLDYLDITNDWWLPNDGWASPWIFRGQCNSRWSLIPSAFRETAQIWLDRFKEGRAPRLIKEVKYLFHHLSQDFISICKKFPDREDGIALFLDNNENIVQILLQAAAETDLIDTFIDLAEDVGHQIPELASSWGRSPWAKTEVHVFKSIYEGRIEINGIPQSSFPVGALAQHHGIPTRLLDWTTNPLKAAFFATQGSSCDQPDKIAVWAIHSDTIEHSDLTLVKHRKSDIGYLHAQEGLFIYDSGANQHFLERGEWRSFEGAVKATSQKMQLTPVRKACLPGEQVDELLRLLWVKKVSPAYLMPTYDNVTEGIRLRIRLETARNKQSPVERSREL